MSLGERQALFDAIDHGLVDLAVLAELALPLRAFARCEMAQPRLATKDLARAGHFEPLCSGLFGLTTCDRSWHIFGAADFREGTPFGNWKIGEIGERVIAATHSS